MPNTRSPQTLFVFKAEYQSACGLSESLFSRPIESHSGLEQNYFILGRTERDRYTDGPSQIWILKTVVCFFFFFSPAHPWVISPSTSWNVISLGSGWVFCCPLPSGWRWYWMKGGHLRLWLDRKARDLRERRLGCISWGRNRGKETRSDLTGECVTVYTMGEMGMDSLH